MILKVGMVARCLNTEHIRGMGRYVYELIRQSGDTSEVEWILFGDDPRYKMVAPADRRTTDDVFTFRGDRFHLWEQLGLPWRCRKHRVDLLHCTEGALPLWQPKPTVITVHDTLAWEEREDSAVAAAYHETVLPAAMRKSAAVITISESSKTDILARWPSLESKLHVIPHGIEDAYFSKEYQALPLDVEEKLAGAPYLIYLGGPMERKRFDWALEVFARSEQHTLKLLACGFGSAARKLAASKLPAELQDRVHFANFLSDGELRALYRGAQAVLYPTLYEGFGFPAVEAQAAGVPVIFSALGSLKELIGPLAVVVPSHDIGAWLAAVDETRIMGEQRKLRAEAAAVWVKQFSWNESYCKHLAVYAQAARAAA